MPIKEVEHLREVIGKDICYIKEKLDNLDKKFDDRLKPVEEENKLNTKFRERFTWTGVLIVSTASAISFILMLISYKFQWLGK